jgi:hypothetical protein
MAQQRQPLQGKVMASEAALPGAFIINKQTGEEVKTDAAGAFAIAAKAGDKLVVYSTVTDVREFYINADSFTAMPYVVSVDVKATQLDEVVVTGPILKPESFGLPEDQQKMTVGERRLHTASTGTLDILLNLLSGKKARLKRELETERKEAVMDNLNGLVNEEEFAQRYGIPAEQVQAFLYYAIDQPEIVKAVNQNNESMVDVQMVETAAKYKALQASQPQPSGTVPEASGSKP